MLQFLCSIYFFIEYNNQKGRGLYMQDKGIALTFKQKEVINLADGRRLGYVQDVCADLETGKITSIIVPGGANKLLNFFSASNDIVIEWEKITCIGEDLILVEL